MVESRFTVHHRFAVALLAVLMLMLPFAPTTAGAADPLDGVTVELGFEGFDALEADERGLVTATVRITDRGELGDHDWLRALATLTEDGAPVAGVGVEFLIAYGDWGLTTTDANGQFFYPPSLQAPLSLTTDPDLLTAAGAEYTIAFRLPAGSYELDAQLVLSSESSEKVLRVDGADRIETAALISKAYFQPGFPVFVARHDDYPDALAGAPALGVLNGPLLLVTTNSLPTATSDELDRLDPSRIVILGGENAVSASVGVALASHTTGPVDRLAGGDRFETAAAIALEYFDPGVPTVYVATGLDWPDAVSGGAAGGFHESPILLVRTDAIPSATAAALRALKPGRIVVLGGTVAVSSAVEAALGAYTTGPVERYAGGDRYDTSAVISAESFEVGSLPVAFLTSGRAFPDALTVAPAAATFPASVLLVTDPIPEATRAELWRLRDGGRIDLVVIGGTEAISLDVEEALAVYTGSSVPDMDTLVPLGHSVSAAFVIPE